MRVFVTGGTGLVGSRLAEQLRARSDVPVVLTRNRAGAAGKLPAGCEIVEGDPTVPGAWQDAVGTCEAVVNLAGENIFARRWSDAFKAKIHASRIDATQNTVAAIARAAVRPAVLVSASAIGYYGFHGDEELSEADGPGDDFLAQSCVEWEAAARAADPLGVRVAVVRIGIVLSTRGGALAQMLTPFKLGVGGPVGSGRQWMAWVHIDDLVGILLMAADDARVRGVVNATAPEPLPNKAFSRALGRALGRPSFFPTPVFMLRLMMGDVADVISHGQRVLPRRTIELGYRFRFPTIAAALADALNKGDKYN